MKKTYTTPVLTAAGNIIRETLGDGQSAPAEFEPTYKSVQSGGVGFYL